MIVKMAMKRSAAYVHPSRNEYVPHEPRRKKQKPDNAGPKSFKKAHPVNDLKSQIRSLKRLLERNDGMPADVRVEKERALRTAQHELERAQHAQQRSDMIGRYHKIRFFDRQKASKRLKRARKELNNCEEDDDNRAELVKRIEDAEVDVNYAQYYPLDRHYVSLFPRKKTKDDDTGENDIDAYEKDEAMERKGDSEMWNKVKECMADGTLDALRNGKLITPEETAHTTKPLGQRTIDGLDRRVVGRQKKGSANAEHDTEADEESENEGFFE